MKCPVCECELKDIGPCGNCGSVLIKKKYKYNKPDALDEGTAIFHINGMRNPVKAGFVQIGTSLRKANLLDIEGQLQNAIDYTSSCNLAYSNLERELGDKYDFVYVGDYLQRLEDPKVFLKELRGHLKPRGVVEFFVDVPKVLSVSKAPQYFFFGLPAFYNMLMLCGYTVIERTLLELDACVLVCAH